MCPVVPVPDLSAEPSRPDSPRGQHDVRMGICFIHVMERHISNHALTDKVFSDKGENGFPCGILRQFAGDGEFNFPRKL